MATFVNPLRLTELATGEGSGTWGTTTNTNLELIGEALGYGTQDCFASDADATTTIADGAVDPARALYFKVTSSATLTATRTLTIAPNTINRVMLIENATTGSQSITISQGSGSTVTIASGQTKMVYLDGAGTGADVVDALANLELGTITVSDLTATTADINGGTIDGAAVGGSTPAAGAFTTLEATSLDSTPIGGTTPAAGSFTTLAATGNTTLDGTAVVKQGLPIINESGTSKTLALTDNGGYIVTSNGSAVTITVPPNSSVAFPTGSEVVVFQGGAGQVTFAAGSGVTIRSKDSNLKITAQYAAATLKKIATDEWHLLGDLEA